MKDRKNTIAVAALGAGMLALIGVGAAAQDSVQPEVYHLVEVDGRALPVVTEEEGDCREELLGATLTLEAAGEWVMVTQEREVCGDQVEQDEDRESGTYSVDGQTVRFLDDDGDPEDLDDDPTGELDIDVEDLVVGTLSAGSLLVQLDDGQTVLTFRK